MVSRPCVPFELDCKNLPNSLKFECFLYVVKSVKALTEFSIVYTKLAEMALLASKDLTIGKKVTSSGA